MKRTIPGLLLALCWLLLLLKGTFLLYGIVIFITTCLGSHEYVKMVLQDEARPAHQYFLTALISFPVVWAIFLPETPSTASFYISFVLLAFYILYRFREIENSYVSLARLILGLGYVGFLGSHLVHLFTLPKGNFWLILLVCITAGSDTGAYISGKRFGKHKLSPNISPNKTIEGAVGGVAAALVLAVVFGLWLLPEVNPLWIAVISLPLAGVGIAGDLFESVIKRGTNTKDSGTILQGHGGILDRMDSILFAGPLLYYLLVFTG